MLSSGFPDYAAGVINVVCAVIRDEEGRLLVCRRPEDKLLAGKWEFPGGKVEAGEDAALALRREIFEELACEIGVGQALPEVEHHYAGFAVRLMPFLCRLRKGQPTAVEHAEILWIKPAECAFLDWADADVPVWQALVTGRN